MQNLELFTGRWRILAEPFELFIALASVVSGLAVLLGGTRPGALMALLSPWVLRAWGAGLCLGGSLTLFARWRLSGAGSLDSLEWAGRVEQLGMILFAGAAAMYATGIFAVGTAGITAGSIIAAFGGACATRAWIIGRTWRPVRDARTCRIDST